MDQIRDIEAYRPRWQAIVMLFAVLNQFRGGITKTDAISHIREKDWFDIQPEDKIPYPSNKYTSKEPRWITSVAWARKDAVERGLMHRGARNDWDLTAQGLNTFTAIRKACCDGGLDPSRCYLWSRNFKQYMNPDYQASAAETRRPKNLYEDWLPRKIQEVLLDI
jgi:hypothetical protein